MHPQVIHCAAAFAVAVVVGTYAGIRRDRSGWPVVALMAAIAAWNLGLASRYAGADGNSLAFLGSYAGAVAIGPLWLLMASRMTRVNYIRGRRALLIGLPSTGVYLAAITNPLHHALYRVDYPQLTDGFTSIATPLLWCFTLWNYALVSLGIGLFVHSAIELARAGHRMRATTIVAVATLPLMAGVASTLGFTPPGHSLVPLSTAIAVSALFAVHWRYQMQATLPLARRDVIEHLTDGVIIIDDAGRILDVNPSAVEIIGIPAVELRQRRLRDAFIDTNAEVEPAEFDGALARTRAGEGPWDHPMRTRDGRFIESTTAEVRGGNGEPAGFFMVLRDTTARRRMEHFLRQDQRLKTVAGLSAGIAHEINNPLAFIRSNLNHIGNLALALEEQLSQARGEKSDICQEINSVAEECREGVDRIEGVVDRVRRFSRISAEQMYSLDIGDVIEDALKMARLQENPLVGLRYRPVHALPPVNASHEHLVQILLNLLDNARQAVTGLPDPLIEIVTEVSGGEVCVRVRDNGAGVPSHLRSRVFDPFFTTDSSAEGTGLGLSIASGIARDHGGSLQLGDADIGGAEFTLRLPTGGEAT